MARARATSLKLRSPGRRADSGNRQPSRVITTFSTARLAILSSMRCTSKPGVPASTRNPTISPGVSVRATMTVTSAKVALPDHFFCPSRTHSTPSRRAWQRRPRAASLPTRGSLSAKLPISLEPAHGAHPPGPLGVAAQDLDARRRQADVHAVEAGHAGIDTTQLQLHQPGHQWVGRRPHEAAGSVEDVVGNAAEAGDDGPGEAPFAPGGVGDGRHLGLEERAQGRPAAALLVGEGVEEAVEVGVGSGHPPP